MEECYTDIDRYISRLNAYLYPYKIPTDVSRLAKLYCNKSSKLCRIKNIDSKTLALSSIYLASRVKHVPIIVKDLNDIESIPNKCVFDCYKKQKRLLKIYPARYTPYIFVDRIVCLLKIDKLKVKKVKQLSYSMIDDLDFIPGLPNTVAGACVYAACRLSKNLVSKVSVARAANVSEPTLQKTITAHN